MDFPPALIPRDGVHIHEPTVRSAREENTALLEALPHGGESVRGAVGVAGSGVLRRGYGAVMQVVEVAAGEDVGGCEGGGGSYAVEEEDLVGGGDENDAVSGNRMPVGVSGVR